jgi:hypothetical protein
VRALPPAKRTLGARPWRRGGLANREHPVYTRSYGSSMNAPSATRHRAMLAVLLSGLLSLAVLPALSQAPHVHGVPGLYDEECGLAALDSLLDHMPLPDAAPTLLIVLVVGTALVSGAVRVSSYASSLTHSRAPPLA